MSCGLHTLCLLCTCASTCACASPLISAFKPRACTPLPAPCYSQMLALPSGRGGQEPRECHAVHTPRPTACRCAGRQSGARACLCPGAKPPLWQRGWRQPGAPCRHSRQRPGHPCNGCQSWHLLAQTCSARVSVVRAARAAAARAAERCLTARYRRQSGWQPQPGTCLAWVSPM